MTSVLDLFSVGIGPSSSHTVGPMRAALLFLARLEPASVTAVHVRLYGSLGATGRGHGSDGAVILGLMGHDAEHVDVDRVPAMLADVRQSGVLSLGGVKSLPFRDGRELKLLPGKRLPFHPNGLEFKAFGADGALLDTQIYYSIGGGFVVSEAEAAADQFSDPAGAVDLPYPFGSGADLLVHTEGADLTIAQVMRANEEAVCGRAALDTHLARVWQVMQACIERGCHKDGTMPGLGVPRRAPGLYEQLKAEEQTATDPLRAMDWVNLWALAVNEENATGGRVVTAPTNGAAGIIPAVLMYAKTYLANVTDARVADFLLTAGAVGKLFKENASISGAEVGCQGEVGSACAMAAAGLAGLMGGSPQQVENAAEIGMEHNLGLTCDPVGGLVQVPCIERNAMGAVKAINAARLAMKGDGTHFVSLDKVIRTLRLTGRDMKTQYKETAKGGLAAVVPIAATVVDC